MSAAEFVIVSNTLGNLLQLFGLIIVFVLILFATYYTTRFVGKNTNIMPHAKNIEVIETFRLSQTKYIQIIKIGSDRYFALAITKDDVTFISEISQDELDLHINTDVTNQKFADIIKSITSKNKNTK